jgi:hypothetical protein
MFFSPFVSRAHRGRAAKVTLTPNATSIASARDLHAAANAAGQPRHRCTCCRSERPEETSPRRNRGKKDAHEDAAAAAAICRPATPPLPLSPTCNLRGNAAPAAPSADLHTARARRKVSTNFCHAATLDELSWCRFSGMLPRFLLHTIFTRLTDLKSKAGGTIDSRLECSLNLIYRINWSFLNTLIVYWTRS